MSIRKLLITSRDPYREICEEVVGINNKGTLIKFLRIFIRYLTRIFGYKNSANIFHFLRRFKFKQDKRIYYYFFYILQLNELRNRNLQIIKNKNFIEFLETKIEWAEFQLRKSLSARARWSAKIYLNLLSQYGLYNKKVFTINKTLNNSYSNNKFYIYGPNSEENPNEDYQDHSLVITKPLKLDLKAFKSKILYLNSIYFQKKVVNHSKFQKELFDEYQEIYVSCRKSLIEKPFKKAPFPLGDNLCGPMALGRILHHLRALEGRFDLVIEGFDFYLESQTYKRYYPSLARKNDNKIDEYLVVKSLSDHDALFNFLYIKNLISDLNIQGSSNFLEIIKMSPTEYLEKLSLIRDTSFL